MTLTPQHHPEPDDIAPGDAPPCGDDCEDRELCVTCGQTLCPTHAADDLEPCAEGGSHCADDCQRTCRDCDRAAWEDERAERADRIRKGDDDY